MPSTFNAHNAESYEQIMGRWSRRLAPLFLEHAGTAPGDVGTLPTGHVGDWSSALVNGHQFYRLRGTFYLGSSSGAFDGGPYVDTLCLQVQYDQ